MREEARATHSHAMQCRTRSSIRRVQARLLPQAASRHANGAYGGPFRARPGAGAIPLEIDQSWEPSDVATPHQHIRIRRPTTRPLHRLARVRRDWNARTAGRDWPFWPRHRFWFGQVGKCVIKLRQLENCPRARIRCEPRATSFIGSPSSGLASCANRAQVATPASRPAARRVSFSGRLTQEPAAGKAPNCRARSTVRSGGGAERRALTAASTRAPAGTGLSGRRLLGFRDGGKERQRRARRHLVPAAAG